MQHVPPSVSKTAFNCPHCAAFANQTWYLLHADNLPPSGTEGLLTRADLVVQKHPCFVGSDRVRSHLLQLVNVSVSECFNCKRLSVWIKSRLAYPGLGVAGPANPDLSEDIRRDYDEASSILDQSPRGAAALLRLAIQKLCKELGQPGKNINDDIGEFVAAGLDPRIQKALDVVRVVGNNAVHPGQIDLRDDRETAETLFSLVNIIAEKMITVPKHINDVFNTLPQNARDAIARRDGKK